MKFESGYSFTFSSNTYKIFYKIFPVFVGTCFFKFLYTFFIEEEEKNMLALLHFPNFLQVKWERAKFEFWSVDWHLALLAQLSPYTFPTFFRGGGGRGPNSNLDDGLHTPLHSYNLKSVYELPELHPKKSHCSLGIRMVSIVVTPSSNNRYPSTDRGSRCNCEHQ